jgi:hypothetical protein
VLAGMLGLVDAVRAAARRDVATRIARARGLHEVVELAAHVRRSRGSGVAEGGAQSAAEDLPVWVGGPGDRLERQRQDADLAEQPRADAGGRACPRPPTAALCSRD